MFAMALNTRAEEEARPDDLNISYGPRTLRSIPVYDETVNDDMPDILRHLIVHHNIHHTKDICSEIRDLGIPCFDEIVIVHLSESGEYIEIQPGFWEHRLTMLTEIESFISLNKDGLFTIKTTGHMPELRTVVHPEDLASLVPRYRDLRLDPDAFAEAVLTCLRDAESRNLIPANGSICNFKEAFVKDVYNVLLRECGPLSSLDIALRLFDSKVGVYKKSQKSVIPVSGPKKEKVFHRPLRSNEIYQLSRVIESVVEETIQANREIFIRTPDGRINSYRNHTGILRIRLGKTRYITINMRDEFDIARKVEIIIDDNKRFLSRLIKQFKAFVDEEEIRSLFYMKIWQAVLLYDDKFGHKLHTFLNKSLKNVLIDFRAKRSKRKDVVSLNSGVSKQAGVDNGEELLNVFRFRDRSKEEADDPATRVCQAKLVDIIKSNFEPDVQDIIFALIDGMSDKEIAERVNKPKAEVVSIRESLRHNKELMSWLSA